VRDTVLESPSTHERGVLVRYVHLHHDLPRVDRQVRIIERPVEFLLRLWLISRIVVWREIRVSESFASLDTFPWVEDKHSLKELDG